MAGWSSATPSSASATSPRRWWTAAVTTCSWSRPTSRGWRRTCKRGWLSRRRPGRWPPLFPPEAPPPPPGRVATTVDKGHGRLERRTLRVTTILTAQQLWPGLKQGFELVRERTEKGKTTVEVVHGISSLPPERADAGRLLRLVREHWHVENRLHYV